MQTSEAHDEPLLRENSYHDRFGDRDNDLERIDGVSGGFSHRSSLEMTDAPFEQIPLREGPSWTAHFYRHASSLASRVNGRKRKSTQATRNGLETSRLVMYLIAIALMMSLVPLWIAQRTNKDANNYLPEAFYNFSSYHFSRWLPFPPTAQLISLVIGVIRPEHLNVFCIGQQTSLKTSNQYHVIRTTTIGERSPYTVPYRPAV